MATAAVSEEPRADLAAWLAVAAGTLGALIATLDISIVNSSLPVIQGEIGASGTEGTWIATAFLVAEIVVIPLAGWLERVFGLRTLLLATVSLFATFSVMCGLATDLTTMILGRIGQGLTGGILIPTAMTIIATRLPRAQQPIGTAAFGAVAILGPVLGPVMGGWLTDNLSWHYAFFINVPIAAVLIVLLMLGLPHEKARPALFFSADWLGIVGLALGLGAFTLVLEEGHKESWFESSYILAMTAAALLGFALMVVGQFRASRPVIQLSLLFRRSFGAVFVTSLAMGAVLYGVAYNIPQFLAAIAGYNAFQAGQIVAISGIPSLIMMAFVPLLIRTVDVRVAVGFGLALLAASCFIDTRLTAYSTGGDFVLSQILRGTGQILAMVFLNQAAISAVSREEAADASGLFNVARNLGGSIGLALLATMQDQRLWFHQRTLESSVTANSEAAQAYVAGQAAALGGGEAGYQGALVQLYQMIAQQALVMTYNDLFFAVGIAVTAVAPLIFLLRPIPKGQTLALH